MNCPRCAALLADYDQKGGVMFTISQVFGRPLERVLECVWLLSDGELTCIWVDRTSQAAEECPSNLEEQDLSQRVA
jgi:hypothetical protein